MVTRHLLFGAALSLSLFACAGGGSNDAASYEGAVGEASVTPPGVVIDGGEAEFKACNANEVIKYDIPKKAECQRAAIDKALVGLEPSRAVAATKVALGAGFDVTSTLPDRVGALRTAYARFCDYLPKTGSLPTDPAGVDADATIRGVCASSIDNVGLWPARYARQFGARPDAETLTVELGSYGLIGPNRQLSPAVADATRACAAKLGDKPTADQLAKAAHCVYGQLAKVSSVLSVPADEASAFADGLEAAGKAYCQGLATVPAQASSDRSAVELNAAWCELDLAANVGGASYQATFVLDIIAIRQEDAKNAKKTPAPNGGL